MRLKYQLFIALLLASALLILLMYMISSWSFSRGLLVYVNQNTLQSAELLVAELETLFEQRQSWDWARGGSPQWRSLSRGENPSAQRPPPRGRRGPRYLLADESRRVVVGPPDIDPATQWLAINGPSGIAGYLGYRNQVRLDSQLDRAFESQQKKSFAYAGIGMVVLSALLAVPMAAVLLRPLLRIGEAVENIRQGEYHYRVSSQRRDELGTLARDINLLAQTLEKNRDIRQRWIAEISHELRTPIAVLRGELEAMQDGIRPITPVAVDSLHAEVMGLNRLVDDLHTLSLSDVGALEYRFEPISFEPLLSEFIENVRGSLADVTLDLTTDLQQTPMTVRADSQRLQQLFSNLFQNSVRYTDTGGKLVVTTRRVNERELQVLWSDSSPGVADAALPKLFDPLFRVEQSRNRALGGAGLGLSIVRRIVQAHNGRISANQSPHGGLEIDIRLPVAFNET
ncbi:MAG: ATP-binding protein [Granulosicoccus sp.]